MNAKQYLSQLSTLERMIQNNIDEIYLLRTAAINQSSYKDGERVQTSISSDRMADIISKIIMLEEECDTLQDRYADLKRKIIMQTNMLSHDRHKDIIRMRYIQKLSIHNIAMKYGITDRGCKKAHKRALEEFNKVMEKCKIGLDSTPIGIVK